MIFGPPLPATSHCLFVCLFVFLSSFLACSTLRSWRSSRRPLRASSRASWGEVGGPAHLSSPLISCQRACCACAAAGPRPFSPVPTGCLAHQPPPPTRGVVPSCFLLLLFCSVFTPLAHPMLAGYIPPLQLQRRGRDVLLLPLMLCSVSDTACPVLAGCTPSPAATPTRTWCPPTSSPTPTPPSSTPRQASSSPTPLSSSSPGSESRV